MSSWSAATVGYTTDNQRVSEEQRTRWVESPCTQHFIYLAVDPVRRDLDLFVRYTKETPALLQQSGRVRGLYWLVQVIKHLDTGVLMASGDLVAKKTGGVESLLYFDLRGVIRGAKPHDVSPEATQEWHHHPCTRLFLYRVAEMLENVWFDQLKDLVTIDPYAAPDIDVAKRYHWVRVGVLAFLGEVLDIYESYEELTL